MKKVVVLTILCVAAVGCVELENICSSDSFVFNGVLVNAFHRFQQNVTYYPLIHYLIHDGVRCDLSEFKDQANFWKALELKNA